MLWIKTYPTKKFRETDKLESDFQFAIYYNLKYVNQ